MEKKTTAWSLPPSLPRLVNQHHYGAGKGGNILGSNPMASLGAEHLLRARPCVQYWEPEGWMPAPAGLGLGLGLSGKTLCKTNRYSSTKANAPEGGILSLKDQNQSVTSQELREAV